MLTDVVALGGGRTGTRPWRAEAHSLSTGHSRQASCSWRDGSASLIISRVQQTPGSSPWRKTSAARACVRATGRMWGASQEVSLDNVEVHVMKACKW